MQARQPLAWQKQVKQTVLSQQPGCDLDELGKKAFVGMPRPPSLNIARQGLPGKKRGIGDHQVKPPPCMRVRIAHIPPHQLQPPGPGAAREITCGLLRRGGVDLHRMHRCRPQLGRHQRQQAGTRADVQHPLSPPHRGHSAEQGGIGTDLHGRCGLAHAKTLELEISGAHPRKHAK